jgi:hypothetical protein
MGIMDKAKQLGEKVTKSGKSDEYIDKARDTMDQATGHRYDDQLDKGAQAAKEAGRKASSGGPADQTDSSNKLEQ